MSTRLEDELLHPQVVADCLSCKMATLRFWRHIGTGPEYVKISPKIVRYPRAKFREYLAERGHNLPEQ